MVDIGGKPATFRRATAAGRIQLSRKTLAAIRRNRVPKGNVLEIARTAAILAAKKTAELLPLAHPIPLEAIAVEFKAGRGHLECRASVSAHWKTGVEMEALLAVTMGLLTVWDLVKPLEKDTSGQYPSTRIHDLRVAQKINASRGGEPRGPRRAPACEPPTP